MILEALVTTRNSDGSINIAPMGPHCAEPVEGSAEQRLDSFELRPFDTSNTFANLKRTGQGVLHVTDDVLLFAQAAIRAVPQTVSLSPAACVAGMFLDDCCRYHEFEISHMDQTASRVSIQCRVLKSWRLRDFFGFNRAKHAVIEASILVTRIDFLPLEQLQVRLGELESPVTKTGGERERLAFRLLQQFARDAAISSGRGVDSLEPSP